MSGAWIAVACAEHVRRGRAGGFMQVCHGKAAPLRRIRPGDRVVYYSPTDRFGGSGPLRAFTAFGTALAGEPYPFDMGDGFIPHRRDVAWRAEAVETPIAALLGRLELTAGRRNWGAPFRFGLVAIGAGDAAVIAAAMGVDPAVGPSLDGTIEALRRQPPHRRFERP